MLTTYDDAGNVQSREEYNDNKEGERIADEETGQPTRSSKSPTAGIRKKLGAVGAAIKRANDRRNRVPTREDIQNERLKADFQEQRTRTEVAKSKARDLKIKRISNTIDTALGPNPFIHGESRRERIPERNPFELGSGGGNFFSEGTNVNMRNPYANDRPSRSQGKKGKKGKRNGGGGSGGFSAENFYLS